MAMGLKLVSPSSREPLALQTVCRLVSPSSREPLALQTSVSIQQETTGTADGLQTSVSIQQGTTADHTEGGVMGSMGVALLSPERIWTILVFTLVACIGSTLTGAIGGYSTNTISNLESNPGRYGIDTSDFRKDTFSVSDIHSVQVSAHVIIWLITRGMCMDVYNHACI